MFLILQYNIDVQIGEHVSSVVKEGQGNVPVGPEGFGVYRCSSTLDLGHVVACGESPRCSLII